MLTEDDMLVLLRAFVQRHNGNVSQAARALHLSRPNLHNLLKGRFRISDTVAQRLGYRRIVRYIPSELEEVNVEAEPT